MTLPVWNGTAADESSGDLTVLVSPTVTVTDKATGAQPNLFSDRAGNTGIGNPFTANADGSIEFYVKPGRYKIVADDGSGNTATWDDQLIGGVNVGGLVFTPEDELGTAAFIPRTEIPRNIFTQLHSGDHTLTTNDEGQLIMVTGDTKITLPPGSDVRAGWCVTVKNVDRGVSPATTTTVEADQSSSPSDTIDGGANITLAEGESKTIVIREDDATNWESIG